MRNKKSPLPEVPETAGAKIPAVHSPPSRKAPLKRLAYFVCYSPATRFLFNEKTASYGQIVTNRYVMPIATGVALAYNKSISPRVNRLQFCLAGTQHRQVCFYDHREKIMCSSRAVQDWQDRCM